MGLIKKAAVRRSASEDEALSLTEIDARLRSADPKERRKAAKAAIGVAGAALLLAEALGRETETSVLERISLSLAEVMDDAVADIVVDHLRSQSAAVRNTVIDLLAERPELLEERIADLMRDPDVDFRIMLVQVALGMRSRGALERLCEALPNEADDNVCGSILEAIATNGEGPIARDAAEQAAARFADHPFLSFVADLARKRAAASVAEG